jgi:HSP20 family molecular chaperone IbpA
MYPAIKVANSLFGGENPFEAFDRLISGDSFPGFYRAPAIDVSENDEAYRIVAELPGLNEKDLKLEIKDRVLSLSVEKTEDADKKDEDADSYIRRERRDFAFSRSFSLPENADEEKITAQFKDGLLTVTLAKKPETAPRLVPVNAA